MDEFLQYIASASSVKILTIEEMWIFWARSPLPAWKALAEKAALLQPSSAAAERVTSMLKYLLSEQQCSAKEDLVESSLRLRYNGRERRK